ncbi:hypothetical protein EDD85DRAFT_831564 [Armillaria nabsnona]|nr:hypothetical protein EDD85DRAFT_831564 [Armillaria nabsnona]
MHEFLNRHTRWTATLAPKRTVDLESMAFNQGGHLMSNKKCKFLDDSFQRAKNWC